MILAFGLLLILSHPAFAQEEAKYSLVSKTLDLQELGIRPTCRQINSDQTTNRLVVDLSFCRPKDFVYKWLTGSRGNCYEVSAGGDQSKWFVKTEPTHCKPKETFFVFVRSKDAVMYGQIGDRAHQCWEKDLQTKGDKYNAVAPLKKCRSLSNRITRLNYLGHDEGCFEVDSILGMDVWIRTLPDKDCTNLKSVDTSFRQVIDKVGPDKGQMRRALEKDLNKAKSE